MFIPDENVIIEDDNPIVNEGDEGKKEDDTSKGKEPKKEAEDAMSVRLQKLEETNQKLMKVFTSPEFFARLAGSMRQPEGPKEVKPSPEELQKEADKLESMSKADFLTHVLSKVGETVTSIVKPEIDRVAGRISTFIEGQAEGTAGASVEDFIERVGRTEFEKYGEVMEATATRFPGMKIDEVYKFVSGKIAPKHPSTIIPNRTEKPQTGLKERTEQKNLNLKDAGERNFNEIFGKSIK